MEAVGSNNLVTELLDDDIVQREYYILVVGEMDAKDLRDTMIDPAKRTLLQYTMEDETLVNETFSKLMGVDSNPRKQFLETDTL